MFIEFLLYKSNHTNAGFLKRLRGTNEELFKPQKAMNDIPGRIKKIEEKKVELEKKAAAGMDFAAIREIDEQQQLLSSDKRS